MKKILLHKHSFKTFWAHYFFHEDQQFLDKLEELGYELELSNQIESIKGCDYALFVGAESVGLQRFRVKSALKYYIKKIIGRAPRNFYDEFINAGMYHKLAFLPLEVSPHLPENASQKMFSMFPRV